MSEMTMNELERFCADQDHPIDERVKRTNEYLLSLPEFLRGEMGSWCRCVITCQSCGLIQGTAHIADAPKLYCPRCGKQTIWNITHWLVNALTVVEKKRK